MQNKEQFNFKPLDSPCGWVTLFRPQITNTTQIASWCLNIFGPDRDRYAVGFMSIFFRDEDDVVLFLLRWSS